MYQLLEIRKHLLLPQIRPFLTEHATQLLVQALVISRLDYCNALLAGLPSNTIKPLQMIQNAAAQLVFNEPKRAHVTPLFVSLHWLLVAARIQFKTPMLAYRTTTGSAPTYFHSLLWIYIPSRSLRSASVDPCQSSSNNWKLISFNSTWQKKKKLSFTFSKSFSFSPSLASSYLFEQCLRLGVIGTSSVCLPLQD